VSLPSKFSAFEITKQTKIKSDEIEQEGAGTTEKDENASQKRKIDLDDPVIYSMTHPVIKTETLLLPKKSKVQIPKQKSQIGEGFVPKNTKIKHRLQFY